MRIMIADDNRLVRQGIRALLADQANYEICAEAADAAQAIENAIATRPDLVLLDVSMPGANGLETARTLRRELPETKILIMSQHDAKQMLPRVLEAGADGFVDKARLGNDLLTTLRTMENATSR